MSKKTKKAMSMLFVVTLIAVIAVGGMLAYLQSSDSDVNVMTLGNVEIEQHEYQRAEGVSHINGGAKEGDLVSFVQGQGLYPAVPTADDAYEAEQAEARCFHWGTYSPGWNGLWDDSKLANVMDKFVFVENTGKSNAYYRTLIALECPEGMTIGYSGNDEINVNINGNSRFAWDYNVGYITIEGTRYQVWCVTYNEALTPGEVSRPSLLQVVMTHNATNEDMDLLGDTYEILTLSQAVQTQGFDTPETALNTAWGEVTADSAKAWFSGVEAPIVVNTAAELKEAIAAGEENVLVMNAKFTEKLVLGSKVNATFVNCEFTGNNAWGYVNDATFQGCTFDAGADNAALHFDRVYGKLIVNDCTFASGKVQIGTDGSSSAEFNNCIFGETTSTSIWAEKGMRFYSPTTFNKCEFNNRVVLAGSNGLSIVFNSCTMNGGTPVYYADNTDGIIRGGNIPDVTIR